MNGTDMERQDLAGEAYFMRAFSYFMLANLYGKPYHPATANEDLCVPLNKEIYLSDKMMKRATNAAVYAQMEEDINKAIQCFKAIGGEKTIFSSPNLPSAYLLITHGLFQEKYDETILYCDSVFTIATQPLYKLQEKKRTTISFLLLTKKSCYPTDLHHLRRI